MAKAIGVVAGLVQLQLRWENWSMAVEDDDNPDDYELLESDERVRKPMSAELQQILDDARAAGFQVDPDPDGSILIVKLRDDGLPEGIMIGPDHVAHRLDVKPWLAEDISDYAMMRAILELQPRSATQ